MFVKFQDQVYLIKDVLKVQTSESKDKRTARHHKRKRAEFETRATPEDSSSSDEFTSLDEVMIGVNVSIDPHKRELVCIRSTDVQTFDVNLYDNENVSRDALYKALELLVLQCVADLPFMYDRRERWVWKFHYNNKRRQVYQVAKVMADGFLAYDKDDEIRHFKFNKIEYDHQDGLMLYQCD